MKNSYTSVRVEGSSKSNNVILQRLQKRKIQWNETVIFSVLAIGTLLVMNLKFGVRLTNSSSDIIRGSGALNKHTPIGKTTGSDSSADMVLQKYEMPDDCPQVMINPTKNQPHRPTLAATRETQELPQYDNIRRDTFAVAMIATGKASETRNVERSIQSLRRRGQFDGRVIVITEQESRYSSLEEADEQITILRIDNSTLHFELKEKMPYKRLKSEVLDLMDTRPELDGYSHVVYMDIDIVIGDRLDDFFAYVEQRIKRAEEKYVIQAGTSGGQETKKSFMMMFEEQGGGIEKAKHKKKIIWHSGVTVFHREHSRKCLDIWRSVIDLNKYKRDQSCLFYMYYSNKELRDQCEIIRMDDKAYFYIPTEDTMALGTSAVFVHNTNTGRAQRIHKKVQYDYYRCAMMLDDSVIRDDILNLKRKVKVLRKEQKAGLKWDGLELIEKATESGDETILDEEDDGDIADGDDYDEDEADDSNDGMQTTDKMQ